LFKIENINELNYNNDLKVDKEEEEEDVEE
jgi:hypothetical protein